MQKVDRGESEATSKSRRIAIALPPELEIKAQQSVATNAPVAASDAATAADRDACAPPPTNLPIEDSILSARFVSIPIFPHLRCKRQTENSTRACNHPLEPVADAVSIPYNPIFLSVVRRPLN